MTTINAIKTIERYDSPFDIVLIDNEKHCYSEAFKAIHENTCGVAEFLDTVTNDPAFKTGFPPKKWW